MLSLLRLRDRTLSGRRPLAGCSVSAQILGYSKPSPSARTPGLGVWRPTAARTPAMADRPGVPGTRLFFRGNGVFQRSSQERWSPCTPALMSGAGGDPVRKATAPTFILTSCISGFHFIFYGFRAYSGEGRGYCARSCALLAVTRLCRLPKSALLPSHRGSVAPSICTKVKPEGNSHGQLPASGSQSCDLLPRPPHSSPCSRHCLPDPEKVLEPSRQASLLLGRPGR